MTKAINSVSFVMSVYSANIIILQLLTAHANFHKILSWTVVVSVGWIRVLMLMLMLMLMSMLMLIVINFLVRCCARVLEKSADADVCADVDADADVVTNADCH